MYRTYHFERTGPLCYCTVMYQHRFSFAAAPPPRPLPPVASAEILRKPAVKGMASLKANPVQSCWHMSSSVYTMINGGFFFPVVYPQRSIAWDLQMRYVTPAIKTFITDMSVVSVQNQVLENAHPRVEIPPKFSSIHSSIQI
jgi:hypothetical protein